MCEMRPIYVKRDLIKKDFWRMCFAFMSESNINLCFRHLQRVHACFSVRCDTTAKNLIGVYAQHLYVYETHHIRVSRVTSEGVMSRINESCHVWMRHVTFKWVMSRINESCHVWMSHVTWHGWVMSRINESCHVWMSDVTYEWVMSRMKESCHVWMSHVTHMNESCHVRMSHVT